MSDEGKSTLTAKQQLFVDDYLIHFNATRAAKTAGYSEKTAYSQGQRLLKNVEISTLINARLKESRMDSDQVMKIMGDIAQSSLNDYFKIVQKQRPKTIMRPLQIQIDTKKEELFREKLFIGRKGLVGDDLSKYQKSLELLEDSILRLEIRLEREPDAEYEDFEMETYDAVEIDLVKLAKDKEGGKIKSFEWKEFGPKVEMYAVDGMLDKLARVNGMYTDTLVVDDKNKIDPNELSDNAIRELMKARKSQ